MKIAPCTLEGARVRLTPLTFEHVPDLCATGLDPRLWEATTLQVTSRAEMESYVSNALVQQSAGTALPFAIVERATGTVVGTTRFHTIVPADSRLEIGYTWIGVPWQRRGINQESKLLLLEHAFERLGCLRVEFRANATNHVSRTAIEALGAKLEAVLRSYRLSQRFGACDLAVYSILASEWPGVRVRLTSRVAPAGS